MLKLFYLDYQFIISGFRIIFSGKPVFIRKIEHDDLRRGVYNGASRQMTANDISLSIGQGNVEMRSIGTDGSGQRYDLPFAREVADRLAVCQSDPGVQDTSGTAYNGSRSDGMAAAVFFNAFSEKLVSGQSDYDWFHVSYSPALLYHNHDKRASRALSSKSFYSRRGK